jgi:hypothetical protein
VVTDKKKLLMVSHQSRWGSGLSPAWLMNTAVHTGLLTYTGYFVLGIFWTGMNMLGVCVVAGGVYLSVWLVCACEAPGRNWSYGAGFPSPLLRASILPFNVRLLLLGCTTPQQTLL